MFNIVLYQPEIAPNTGNIIRLCANSGARLHLVYPLGFEWDSARVKRAGLDYHEFADVVHHADWEACKLALAGKRLFALSTKNSERYDKVAFVPDDCFVFGPETRGLPADVLASFEPAQRLTLPMRPGNRSLNLANSVAIVAYEAWRQHNFS
jgi:tRNA (cytidine/uridine-2'-O-)-methyltransferase